MRSRCEPAPPRVDYGDPSFLEPFRVLLGALERRLRFYCERFGLSFEESD